jgi:hypothetical protein
MDTTKTKTDVKKHIRALKAKRDEAISRQALEEVGQIRRYSHLSVNLGVGRAAKQAPRPLLLQALLSRVICVRSRRASTCPSDSAPILPITS